MTQPKHVYQQWVRKVRFSYYAMGSDESPDYCANKQKLPATPMYLLKLHARYVQAVTRTRGAERDDGWSLAAFASATQRVHSQSSFEASRLGLRAVEPEVRGGDTSEKMKNVDSREASNDHAGFGRLSQGFEVCLYDGTLVSWLDGGTSSVFEAMGACCRALGIENVASRYLALHVADERGFVADNCLEFDMPLREAAHRFDDAFECSGILPPTSDVKSRRLILCVRLWTRELAQRVTSGLATEVGLLRVAYAQTVASVVSGVWSCPLADAALVAAVQLSQRAGGFESALSVVRTGLHNVLPMRLLESHDWEVDVLVELRSRLNDRGASPRADLLAICQTWQEYGSVDVGEARVVTPPEASLCPIYALGRVRLGHKGIIVDFNESAVRLTFALRCLDRWHLTKPDELSFDFTPANGPDGSSDSNATWSLSACRARARQRVLNAVRCKLVGLSRAQLVCKLLDEYAALDFVEEAPTHRYARMATPARAPFTTTLYNSLIAAVVRPPRSIYELRRLGPSSFELSPGWRFHRKDIVLKNASGRDLQCSHWISVSPLVKQPCVVFIHANSASRVQALQYARTVLSIGASFFAFDCDGSGLSDGDYVSLGWKEAADLAVVARYLRNLGTVSSLAAWGCSMGAAAIIFYMAKAPGASAATKLYPPSKGTSSLSNHNHTSRLRQTAMPQSFTAFDAVVLDSPYSDATQLALDLAASKDIAGFATPNLLASVLLHLVDRSIQLLHNFSVFDLRPIDHVPQCNSPALFVHAENDQLVNFNHLEPLVSGYAGPRLLATVDGSHSTPRSLKALHFVQLFLAESALSPPGHALPHPNSDNLISFLPFLKPRHHPP